jgi:hypothetical protein
MPCEGRSGVFCGLSAFNSWKVLINKNISYLYISLIAIWQRFEPSKNGGEKTTRLSKTTQPIKFLDRSNSNQTIVPIFK